MNLPGLGKHCDLVGCKQLDFLPFACEHCKGTFCLAHHKYQDHACTFKREVLNQMPTCPVCGQEVYVQANESKDRIMDQHLASGCQQHLIAQHRQVAKENLSIATKCFHPLGCRNPNKYSTIICSKCHQQYCLTHRLPDSHQCASVQVTSASKPTSLAKSSNDKHARGNELLAKIAAKKEAKAVAAAEAAKQHAAAYPTSSSTSTSSSKTSNKGFLTLQQIRASINSGASAAMNAISSVIPSSMTPSPSPTPAASSASSASTSALLAPSPSPAPSASPSPVPSSSPSSGSLYPPVPLTLAARRSALGDPSIPESDRIYFQVDVTPIKSKKPPTLCFFSRRHTIGKILDIICEASGIENENHLTNGKKIYLTAPRIGANLETSIPLELFEGSLQTGDILRLQRQPIASH